MTLTPILLIPTYKTAKWWMRRDEVAGIADSASAQFMQQSMRPQVPVLPYPAEQRADRSTGYLPRSPYPYRDHLSAGQDRPDILRLPSSINAPAHMEIAPSGRRGYVDMFACLSGRQADGRMTLQILPKDCRDRSHCDAASRVHDSPHGLLPGWDSHADQAKAKPETKPKSKQTGTRLPDRGWSRTPSSLVGGSIRAPLGSWI